MLRAGSHGLASGVVSALDGGNFASAFVSDAAASGIGSYAKTIKGLETWQMVSSTAAMGGVVAWISGGNFLEGALSSLQIAAFNHLAHDGGPGDGGTGYARTLPDGTLEAKEPLQEVVCKGSCPRRRILFDKRSDAGKVSVLSRSIIIEAMAEAGLTVIHVTSTVRSPESQANAMYNNQRNGNRITYKEAGTKVLKCYPNKPTSPNQKYYLTDLGKALFTYEMKETEDMENVNDKVRHMILALKGDEKRIALELLKGIHFSD